MFIYMYIPLYMHNFWIKIFTLWVMMKNHWKWFHFTESESEVKVLVAQSCPTLSEPARLLCPWNLPSKNTGVGCYFLLQGIFLTQGLNSTLLHWQADSITLLVSTFFFFLKQQRLRLQFYDCLNRMTEGGRWMEKIFI